jgi:hypothetical protein
MMDGFFKLMININPLVEASSMLTALKNIVTAIQVYSDYALWFLSHHLGLKSWLHEF